MGHHKEDYKKWISNGTKKNLLTSSKLLQYNDAYIELIEEVDVNSKEELHKIEGQHIRNTENCINKQIAGRTPAEYRKDNRESLLIKKKEYYENNKEKCKLKSLLYRSAQKFIKSLTEPEDKFMF